MNNDQENKDKKSELTDKSKADKSDTGNSLERDAKGEFGSNNPTPQARTDNEEDSEQQKRD